MKNKSVKKVKKFDKKKSLMYTVFGVIGAFVVLFGALYLTEYFQRMVWHNGKVIVGENIITLPCSIEEFERTLNPEIVFDKDVEHVRNVKVGSVRFSIEVKDGAGTVFESGETSKTLIAYLYKNGNIVTTEIVGY